jgi:uracil-DNA glycosylase
LEEIATKAIPPSWERVFFEAREEIKLLNEIIAEKERKGEAIVPHKRDIFRAFYLTRIDSVKVVIFGQDPYPGKTSGIYHAMGLSFAVRKGIPIPSSLRNVYLELANSLGFINPRHGDLSFWAEQGVLLINKALTLSLGSKRSHCEIWSGFISRIIEAILAINPHCIFLLWGEEAKKLNQSINNRGHVLMAGHPSGLNRRNPFVGCGHFLRVNEILVGLGRETIMWQLPL